MEGLPPRAKTNGSLAEQRSHSLRLVVAILGRPYEADVKGRLIFLQTELSSPPTFYSSGQMYSQSARVRAMRLLVVEDELRMLELLRRGLTEEGHAVFCAVDGHEALSKLREREFDVVILDVMLPKMSGFELALQMRTEKNSTPVLMLTARDSVPDIERGLDLGADDYMTKPFSFHELLLRLRAVKRRASACKPPTLQLKDLWLDPATREVSRAGEAISLTRTEYSLLDRLMSNAGRVVPRDTLILSVWGQEPEIEGNTLDAFMHLLRKKIDTNSRERLIHTVRGVGYIMRSEV